MQCANEFMFQSHMRFYVTQWSATRFCGSLSVYVVVQFCLWFKFYFPLFRGKVIYDNEFKTKENKI